MKKNDGKYLEHLVQLIEKSISPNSKVEHNIWLPVLTSTIGAKRQCDITIRTGEKPRETLTIVEVQDRESQVDPNTVGGWKNKMEEVGAQHLICVSRQEFSESVKEKAAQSGNTIRLIVLQELPTELVPLDFFNFKCSYRTFSLTAINYIRLVFPNGYRKPKGFDTSKKIYSIDKENLLSIHMLCRDIYKPDENQLQGKGDLRFDVFKDSLYYFYRGNFIKVGLSLIFDWKQEITEMPISTISYTQNDFGALAWILEATHNISPDTIIRIRIPVIHDGESYKISYMQALVPENTTISMGNSSKIKINEIKDPNEGINKVKPDKNKK